MKPLQLKITGIPEAKELLSGPDADKWQGLVSCHDRAPHLTFSVYPAELTAWLNISDHTPWEVGPEQAKKLATAADVLALAELAKRLPNHARVLVHCGAGCCRSTAAAMVLFVAAGWPDHTAVEKVRRLKNGGGIPNGWMLKLADVMFGCMLFDVCANSGNTKWTPPWMKGVPWTNAEREKANVSKT